MDKGKIGSLSSDDTNYINERYQKRMSTAIVSERKGVVICLDVLGWKNYSRPNQIENLTTLTAGLESIILEETLKVSNNKECDVDIINLSDTIFIFISDNSTYFFVNVFKSLAKFVNNAFLFSFAFRGAISYGKYNYNATKNIFTGDAVYEAAKYCESTEWAGIIITDSLTKELLKENDYETIEKINLIRYENIPYKKNFLKKQPNKTQEGFVLNPNTIATNSFGEYMIDENLIEKYTYYFSNGTGIIPEDLKQKHENTIKFIKYVNKFSTLPKGR